MSGVARPAGDPAPLFARWCRIDTGGGTSGEDITERWCMLFDEERAFWREADGTTGTGQAAKPADTGPRAVTMEIVERNHKTTDSVGGSIIVPNEVRINGVSVLTSADEPIRVHEVELPGNRSAALVTLTLFVRRLVVAAEGDLDGITPAAPSAAEAATQAGTVS